MLSVCFQEEVQNPLRGYGAPEGPARRRAEESYGQAERQGTGQGSCEQITCISKRLYRFVQSCGFHFLDVTEQPR